MLAPQITPEGVPLASAEGQPQCGLCPLNSYGARGGHGL